MKNTHFRDDHAEIVKNMAYGYVPAKDTFRISITNFDTVGATGLLTTVEDLALWDGYEMNALSENDFRLASAPIDFKFEALKPGGRLRLIMKHGEDKPEVFEAVSPFTPSTSELSSCVGFYYSEEIEPIYVMKIDDGKLVLHTLKNKPDTLRPITPDLFAASIGTIRFKRNAQHQVSGFVLNADHVRNMRFQKGSGRPERP